MTRTIQEQADVCRECLPGRLVTMQDLNSEIIARLFALAETIERAKPGAISRALEGRVLATLFYQPSTRTRLNFEAAAQRLGMGVIGFSDPKSTRAGDFYNETLEDVVRFTSNICNVIALRHFESGAADRAAKASAVPLINAGDGYNQHPTQALGDIWTMSKCLGGIEGKRIGLVGDLGIRSLRAIVYGLCMLKVGEISFLLPPDKALPPELAEQCANSRVSLRPCTHIQELMGQVDLVETIGVNHPNHGLSRDEVGRGRVQTSDRYRIDAAVLNAIEPKARPFVLHPGPRTDEVSSDCDGLPQAMYFLQARNGMWMRMGLLMSLAS